MRAIRFKQRFIIVTLCSIICFTLFLSAFRSKAGAADEKVFKYYTSLQISYGDTLWNIGDQYKDNGYSSKSAYLKEIRSINHISNDDKLIAGQYLIIPYYSSEYVSDAD